MKLTQIQLMSIIQNRLKDGYKMYWYSGGTTTKEFHGYLFIPEEIYKTLELALFLKLNMG